MDEDLRRRLQRWHEAEASGRDDKADAACRAVFVEVPREAAVSTDFTASTLAAIAAATAGDARRARRVRRALVAAGVAAMAGGIYLGGGWALSAASTLLVTVVDLLVGTTVRIATSVQTGADVWSVLGSLGRAAAAFLTDSTVTIAMFAIQAIAMTALIVLQRLLRSDRESLE